MPRIVIVGGGLAGAACALHFLRDHSFRVEADLTVIEPREILGAGLAYSTPAPEHRINVAASRMSLFPEDPLNFEAFARAQNVPEHDPASQMPDGRLYPARAVFGRYVSSMLAEAIEAACGRIRFFHARAVAQSVLQVGEGFRIALRNGDTVEADALVLAVSHTAPDLPAVFSGLGNVIANPWHVPALREIPARARVLIVGTGLTACDVVASLLAQNHLGPITALSRHGMLPRPRTEKPVEAEGDFSTHPETTALGLLRRIRAAVAIAQAAGRPSENIVDALRQQADAAWGTLDWPERRRLLRHLRTYWDVHRFQSAPQIDAALAGARKTGQFCVRAGFLLAARETAKSIAIEYRRPRSATGESEFVYADVIINCTGPGHRSVIATHPVLKNLAQSGALQPDPARLGIFVDQESRVIRADGHAWKNLFVAGPLARGTHGELMGLPQVNLQPRAVAHGVAALFA